MKWLALGEDGSARAITTRLLIVSILFLVGCASDAPKGGSHADWIQGQITSLSDAVVMPMQIQKKWAIGGSASGGIAAQNPKTGETFEGRYTAMLRTVGSANTGGTVTHFSTRNANAQATMNGNKGTTISFDLEIMAGWSPHGFGQGIDGQGRQYRLQF
jgi:hypothetical protein